MLVVWLKKTDFNAKVIEIKGKIPDVNSLVKKTDYATEITNIKNDYVTNAALNARHKDLIQKTKFDTEVKKINDKIASNSSEVLKYNNRLNQSKDRVDELERIASYLIKNYFDGDGTQNYLVFQGVYKYFEDIDFNRYQKLLLNFMLIHGYQKDYLMKKLALIVGLYVNL